MIYPATAHAQKTFQELVKLLPANERNKPQVLLLAGGVVEYRNDTDRELIFRQESNFYYLSGSNTPGSFVLAAFQSGTSLESTPSLDLFIPKAELADIMWSVPPPTLEEAGKISNVTKVDHPAALPGAIETILKAFPDALFHTLPKGDPRFPALSAEYTDLVLSSGAITDAYLLPALHRARLTKDAFEIEEIRKANAISSRAHETVMRVLGAGIQNKIKQAADAGNRPLLPGEWLIETEGEAEAIFVASCRRENSIHQAYPPIVAASSRASTLHYCCNDKPFAWGPVGTNDHLNCNALIDEQKKNYNPQVLLIDAGCEWQNYASDITRTMPVGNGGKFTKEAREIYELVLEMQKQSFDLLRPGTHWDAVHLLCHRVLIQGFQRLSIFKTPNSPGGTSAHSEEAILASGVSTAFFPHGLGHSLGMDVHDVPSASKPENNTTLPPLTLGNEALYQYLRLRLPLEVGMVVTVEPGIYFSPHLLEAVRSSPLINHDVLARYESVGGVRIEDVVVIRENQDGQGYYENLTTVRSDTDWVEGVCSGVL